MESTDNEYKQALADLPSLTKSTEKEKTDPVVTSFDSTSFPTLKTPNPPKTLEHAANATTHKLHTHRKSGGSHHSFSSSTHKLARSPRNGILNRIRSLDNWNA
eukprot:comp12211_c0_seq1/m.6981 comp12211_c0_seq1/g.6981  ORF comp12211_c0_seq1/g.6981 comp12211_c0_seq1/m.6981 type:complete len:103 (+) comp12211_c0_seq1:94-402(+)